MGVLFDAQGELIAPPTILRSTGYMALDAEIKARLTAAEQWSNSHPLANRQTRRSNAYVVGVEVDYDGDACVSLTDLKTS